jgi:hypothetical protein
MGVNMNDTVINLQEFKDGVADGLLEGVRKTFNSNRVSDAYKQGYDFGLYLYNEQLEGEEHE